MILKNRLLFALYTSLVTLPVFSQNNTASPYSMYGLGKIEYKGDVTNMGIGHTGLAVPASNFINIVNAASLSQMDSLTMLFNIQTQGTYSNFETSQKNQTNINGNINGIALAFKRNERWGMCFSLSPYSNIGYNIHSEKYIIGTTITHPVIYKGKGGIFELAWSNGIKLFRNFSVGLKTSLLWGNTDIIETSEYADITGETIHNKHSYHMSNMNLEYSFQYFITLSKYTVSFGGNYNAQTSLNTWYEHNIYTDGEVEYYSDKTDVNDMFLPTNYGVGIAIQSQQSWLIAFDYHRGDWANINLANTTSKTLNRNQFNFGIQFSPQKNRNRSIFNRMKYRAGAFYSDNYLMIKDVELNEKGLTAGLTIPLKNNSLINLGYEYKMGGSLKKGLIKENFHSFKLGITFNERWFNKHVFK